MSIWQTHDVEQAVVEALEAVHLNNPDGHHFGRPYVTAYQLAIAVQGAHPEIAEALQVELGGKGTGVRNSLAQYLARQLSGNIKRHGTAYPVEGAFISNEKLTALTFEDEDGREVVSSLTGTGLDLSLFRLRVAPDAEGAR